MASSLFWEGGGQTHTRERNAVHSRGEEDEHGSVRLCNVVNEPIG